MRTCKGWSTFFSTNLPKGILTDFISGYETPPTFSHIFASGWNCSRQCIFTDLGTPMFLEIEPQRLHVPMSLSKFANIPVSSSVIPASTNGVEMFFSFIVVSNISGRQSRKSMSAFFLRGLLSKFKPPRRKWVEKYSLIVWARPQDVLSFAVILFCRNFRRRNTGDKSHSCCVPVAAAECLLRMGAEVYLRQTKSRP